MSVPPRSLSSTRLIRSFNVVSVLQTLYREGAASKADITRITSMSPATVTRIVSALIEQGLVSEYKIAESTGGRKPIVFRLKDDKLYAVGIQFVRDHVALGLCDFQGRILTKRLFEPYSLVPENLVAELGKEFELLLAADGVNREHIIGCGLAITGIVNAGAGNLLQSINLGWHNVELSKILEDALGFPVVVENDANAAALAEFWFGRAKETPDFMYLKTDGGVGAGIVINGKLITGPHGMTGEIGHIPIVEDGHECVCGQHGCLETYLYAQGLLRRYEVETGVHLKSVGEFFHLIASGDPAAVKLKNEAVKAVSLAVSYAANLLDLDLVIIGGLWGGLGEEFCGRVEENCRRTIEHSGLAKPFRVRGSALGEDSDILGAVGIVIHKWLTPVI